MRERERTRGWKGGLHVWMRCVHKWCSMTPQPDRLHGKPFSGSDTVCEICGFREKERENGRVGYMYG